jgi:hypothetical protein
MAMTVVRYIEPTVVRRVGLASVVSVFCQSRPVVAGQVARRQLRLQLQQALTVPPKPRRPTLSKQRPNSPIIGRVSERRSEG